MTYLTVKQFTAEHPAFTIGGLRAWIFNEKLNGLAESGAVIRIGRKILIDEAKFFEWIEAQNRKHITRADYGSNASSQRGGGMMTNYKKAAGDGVPQAALATLFYSCHFSAILNRLKAAVYRLAPWLFL